MPLLDHFHPPLRGRRHWEGFHGRWANAIADRLNDHFLPAGYFAEALLQVGGVVGIDVATFDEQAGNGAVGRSSAIEGVATAVWAPPVPTLDLPAVFPDSLEVLVFGGSTGPHLVAAVELVSPANKDRPSTRRAFAAKVAAYLQQGVGVVVVDIVTDHHFNLHEEWLVLLAHQAEPDAAAPHTYAAAYRPTRRPAEDGGTSDRIEVWTAPLVVEQPLPTLPLAVRGLATLPLDLESTYTEARQRLKLD